MPAVQLSRCFLGVGFCVIPSTALAQAGSGRVGAVQAFDHATELMAQGKIAEACPVFAASLKLDPQIGAALHLADCYAKNGQLATAWSSFKDAEEMARVRADERATFAHDQAAQLEPRLSRLTINALGSLPAGLEVRVDGVVLPTALLGTATPVDPGRHVVESSAPGCKPWSSTVQVEGEAQRASVVLPTLEKLQSSSAVSNEGGPAMVDAGVSSPDAGGASLRTLGWVGIGAGAIGLGVGTAFLIQKDRTVTERDNICPGYHDCSQDQAADIRARTSTASGQLTISTVGFIAGGLLAAGGVVSLVLGFKHQPSRDKTALVAPLINSDTLGMAGWMRW